MKLLNILLFISLGVGAYAQSPQFNSQIHYKVEDGLPQSFVSGIRQDPDGFIWVATLGGLARFDGKNFLPLLPGSADSSGISSSMVVGLKDGPRNTFFVEFENLNHDLFDPVAKKVVNKKEMGWLRDHKLFPVFGDSRGRWWMRTKDWQFVLANPEKKLAIQLNTTGDNGKHHVMGLVEGHDKEIYAFTRNGVGKYDPVQKKFAFTDYPFPFSEEVYVYSFKALPDGNIVMTCPRELIFYNTTSGKFKVVPLPENVKGAIVRSQVAADGFLYLAIGSGIYRVGKNQQFQYLWELGGTTKDEKDIISFLVDNTDVLWVGTNANGLFKINLKGLPILSAPYAVNFHYDVLKHLPGFEAMIPRGKLPDKWSYFFRYHYLADGTLICSLGTDELGLLKYSNGKWSMLPGAHIKTIGIRGITSMGKTVMAIDVDGGLWTWPDTQTLPFYTDLNKTSGVGSVAGMVSDGKYLLIATERNGIYKFLNGRLVRHYNVTSTKQSTVPFEVSFLTGIIPNPSDKNRFWIGTLGQGILDWDIGTGFKNVLSEKDNLPSGVIYNMATDRQNRLWLGSNKGLSVIDPKKPKAYTFQKADGLPGNEFNRFHVFTFPDGQLAFGGLEGYVIIDPDKFQADNMQVKTALTSLDIKNVPQIFGKSHWLSEPLNLIKSLELPYDQNYLTISFAGIAFRNPGQLSYRYKLENYDKTWNVIGNQTTANYTGLPPGNYTFLVNAANTSGQWSRFVKRLDIHISPPFWATWWAYLLYAAIVLLVLRGYLKFRENQLKIHHKMEVDEAKARNLEEVDAVKTRFFDNITHELRTPLTLILTPLGRLLEQPGLPYLQQRNITYAWDNAKRLLDTVNQMLDISKVESGKMQVNDALGNLGEYIGQCVHAFEAEAEAGKIELKQLVELESALYYFDADKWGKIIFNLVGNAMKYTPAGGAVTLSAKVNSDTSQVTMLVRDTGIGMDQATMEHIFERFYVAVSDKGPYRRGTGIGLSLVKELVELLGGTVSVQSEPGQGSEFKVILPLREAGPIPAENYEKASSNGAAVHYEEFKDQELPLVLLAEDNEELRQFLSESLKANWRVLAAPDGNSAWELIVEELPDLIVSDVMMPGMNGYELCSKVKSDLRTAHIPLLLLTAKAAPNSRMEGLVAGADDYLSKPFHFNELEQIIHTRLLHQERVKKHLALSALPEIPPAEVINTGDPFLAHLYTQLDALILQAEVNVDILALSVNMSRRTLGRKLKTLLDISPNELIRRYRLQKAALLLSNGKIVTQAAYEVGFDNPSYFSQCFKEQYGVSPSTFIQQQRGVSVKSEK